MDDIAIKVENVSKLYRLGSQNVSLKEMLLNFRRKSGKDFWALKDIDFEIKQGEAVGIIGGNGAGKSTLLKILSKITMPSTGRITLEGKVASLLEVGTGFHPDLSGRENIFLNGSILGMKRSEIKNRYNRIVEFSGIEEFIETPVKKYSSGMYVRLAFAVAAHLEPEILIIDEVLAVGDLEFQNKCLGKMNDVVSEGRTILFVSHNLNAVSTLTQKCLFLEKGKMVSFGRTQDVIKQYLQRNTSEGTNGSYVNDHSVKPENYIKSAKIKSISEAHGTYLWGEHLEVEFIFSLKSNIRDTGFSFQISNNENIAISHFSPQDMSLNLAKQVGPNEYSIKCVIPKLRLFMGRYHLTTWLADNKSKTLLENLGHICDFEISMANKNRPIYEWKQSDGLYLEDYYFE